MAVYDIAHSLPRGCVGRVFPFTEDETQRHFSNLSGTFRWKDNIRMDLEEIGMNVGNWTDSANDWDYWRTLVNVALNLWVPEAMELVR